MQVHHYVHMLNLQEQKAKRRGGLGKGRSPRRAHLLLWPHPPTYPFPKPGQQPEVNPDLLSSSACNGSGKETMAEKSLGRRAFREHGRGLGTG